MDCGAERMHMPSMPGGAAMNAANETKEEKI
jgi:hypothetical protein